MNYYITFADKTVEKITDCTVEYIPDQRLIGHDLRGAVAVEEGMPRYQMRFKLPTINKSL